MEEINDIEVSNKDKNLVQSKIEKAFSEEFKKKNEMDFEKLQNSAIKMLKNINSAVNTVRSIKKRYNSIIKDSGVELKSYIDQHSTGALAGKIQFEILKFEEQLNFFLNRDIRLTLVDETGNIFVTSKVFAREIYKNAKGQKGEFKLPSNAFKKAKNKNKSINLKSIKELNVNSYTDIYKTALKRFNDTVQEYKNSSKPGTFIYWNISNQRKYGFVQSKGSLAEAYVAAVYNQDKYTGDKEENIRDWYFNRVRAVDSAQETVSGDIGEQGDALQLAVKAAGASFGSYKQWIDLAVTISKITPSDVIDIEKMKEIINDLARTPVLINKLKKEVLTKYRTIFAGLDIVD